jgi:hypothetical protein
LIKIFGNGTAVKRLLLLIVLVSVSVIGLSQTKFRVGIFLHHSTGDNIWGPNGSVTSIPLETAKYNSDHGLSGDAAVSINESWWPDGANSGNNEWYYWHIIFENRDLSNSDIRPILAANKIVVIKSCFPSSWIDRAGHASDTLTPTEKTIYNYKWHWRHIVDVMKKHPENFFVIWTNAPVVAGQTDATMAGNAKKFCQWAKDTLAKGYDAKVGAFPKNIYVFDYFSKLTDANGYELLQYAVNSGDSHPNSAATALVAPQFASEIFNAALAYEQSLLYVNVALNKPTTCQLFQPGHESSYANDADGTNNSFWSATPYSKWWKVDLQAIYNINQVTIRNIVSGSSSYQYGIMVSTDDVTYTQVASKTNRNVAVNAGDNYFVNTTARYIRVNMTYNSANMSVNITDFKAYGIPAPNLPSYTFVSSAGAHGTIAPSGTIFVSRGSRQVYTISPNSGYKVSSIIVDGISAGTSTSYAFNYVTSDHNISASFSLQKSYQLTSSVIGSGSILPAGTTTVNEGESRTYTLTPDPGYVIDAVLVDNVNVGSVSSYTFTNVSAAHNIRAVFVAMHQIFAFVPNVDQGSITPADAIVVKDGSSQTYKIVPSPGFTVYDVIIDGMSAGAVTIYTFTNITEDHCIYAAFIPVYEIFAFVLNSDQGTITPSDIVVVRQGDDQTFNITANSGFEIAQVTVDEKPVGALSTYTFEKVDSSHSIYAEFSAGSQESKGGSSLTILPGKYEKMTMSIPEKLFGEQQLEVDPNPFTDGFNMSIKYPQNELFDVYVTDLNGKILLSLPSTPSNTSIYIQLPAATGTYLILARNNRSVLTRRVIKY